MKFISYIVFRAFVLFFKILPFKTLYLLSNIISFLLLNVIKYRKNVVESNIERVFYDHSPLEKQQIIETSYRNLSDILLEGLKGIGMNRNQLTERYKYINPEILDESFANKQSIILATGHYNNWEWAALASTYFFKHHVVGIYKKLSNPYVEKYFKKSRANTGIILYELNETSVGFQKQAMAELPSIYLMAGDQSPSNISKSYWTKFLGIETPCLHGIEKYSIGYDLPIVYCDIQRIRRGYYELKLSWIVKDPKQYLEGEITAIYMKKLESLIKSKPGNWLWTHKRWKHKYNGQKIVEVNDFGLKNRS